MTSNTATQRPIVATFALLFLACASLPAAEFAVEKLGVVERQAGVGGLAISPATKRYPCRLLIGLGGTDGTWIVNLHDGASRKAKSPGFESDSMGWPWLVGADGKVFSSCVRGGLSVYDPVTDKITLVRPIEKARWLRGLAIGPDDCVYVSDYPTGSAAKYDPTTGRVTRFGRQGGPFTITHVYGYSIGCDSRYVYTAAGKIPWYVVAYDTKTGKQENLLRFDAADQPEIYQVGKRVFLQVRHSSPKKGEPAVTYHQLVDGRVESAKSIPRADVSHVPGKNHAQPEIEPPGRNLPIVNGKAAIRYRMSGKPWRTATLPISGQDMSVDRIAPMPDGRVLLYTGPYGNVHTFDPKSKAYTRVGNPVSKGVYDLLMADGRIYFCGYPNSILGVFDRVRGKPAAGRLIGNWHDVTRSKYALFLVKGADGRLYSGNHNERESTGGALGWYDPARDTFGGVHFPNDDCEWLTTASEGRFIVYASDFSHDPTHPEIKKRNGKLLIYDTAKHRIIREMEPLSDGSAGVVVETAAGVLFGVGLHDKLPVMYTVDIAAGQLGERRPLPSKAYRAIMRGPDGKAYFFLNNKLVRADPKTFRIETLCPAQPGRMVFVGDDLYLSGSTQLRRIVGVARR